MNSKVRKQWSNLPTNTVEEIAERQMENDIRNELSLPSVDEFAHSSPQQSLFLNGKS